MISPYFEYLYWLGAPKKPLSPPAPQNLNGIYGQNLKTTGKIFFSLRILLLAFEKFSFPCFASQAQWTSVFSLRFPNLSYLLQ